MSQTRKQIQGQQEEERVCPITIKIYFQLFILVNPLSPPSHLPPRAISRAALQSEQAYNIPLLQSSVLLGLVVMCIRIHIIITHSPRCTAEGILASTQLERTEQNRTERNKIASENKNTTCHTPMPPSPRRSMLCELCTTVLLLLQANEHVCINIPCACRQQQDHQIVFVANTNEHTPAHLPSHLGQSVRH